MARRRKSILSILFVSFSSLCFLSPLSALSEYVPNKRNAFGFELGFTTFKDSTSFDLGATMSILGYADLGLQYSQISIEDPMIDDLSATSLNLFISAFPVKQSAEIPLSIELAWGVGFAAYDSEFLDYVGWDMSGTSISLGFSVYHRYNATPSFALVPSLGFSYTRTKVTLEDSYGKSIEESDSETGFGFGLPFVFSISPSGSLIFRPSLFILDGETMFSVSIVLLGLF